MNQDESKKPDYLIQLDELYNVYKGQEVADALGVTVRQIQNYLKAISPATPSKQVLLSIREAYTNHKNGKGLLSAQHAPDYRDDMIAYLKKEISLNEARVLQLLQRNHAMLKGVVEILPILVAKVEKIKPEEAAEEMRNKIEHHLDVLKKESI